MQPSAAACAMPASIPIGARHLFLFVIGPLASGGRRTSRLPTRGNRQSHRIDAVSFVAVTRLHLVTLRSLPMFSWYSLMSARQARGTAGFEGGWLGTDAEFGLWTATMWDAPPAMRAFRNSGIHVRAMPRLLRWCDEASYAHWEQEDAVVPDVTTAYARLQGDGRLSKVNRPSALQKAGVMVGRHHPRIALRLKARSA
jgi:hypothetical protein